MQKKLFLTSFMGTFLLIIAFFITTMSQSHANTPVDICYRAIKTAAPKAGVPTDILAGIALTETGRKTNGTHAPWPWAINANGKGYWVKNKADAIAKVKSLQAQGIRSIDVGCMQINLKWHKGAFSSLEEAFDPYANVSYAAKFLRNLKSETSSWMIAAGHYHSKTSVHANRYRNVVMSNAKRAIAALSITPSGYLKGSFPFENKTPIELNNNNRRAVAVVQQPNPLLMSRYRIGQQTGNPHDYNKTAFVNIPNSPIYKNSAGNGNNGNGTIAYKNNVPQNAVIDMKAVKADREAKSLLLAANAPLLHMY